MRHLYFFSIHDHSDSHCFVKVLEGTLLETLYEWPKNDELQVASNERVEPMKKVSESYYEVDAVSYMSGKQVFNIKSQIKTESLVGFCLGIRNPGGYSMTEKFGRDRNPGIKNCEKRHLKNLIFCVEMEIGKSIDTPGMIDFPIIY